MVLFKKIAAAGKYHDPQAIPDVVAYITRPDKTPSGIIYGSHVDMQNIAGSMVTVSEGFCKNSRLRLHHFILTFHPKDINLLPQIAQEVCAYIGRAYQIVAAQHEDTPNPHIHFVFNAVSFVNGYKYRGGKEDYYELIDQMSSIIHRYGLYPLIPIKYIPDPQAPHE